MSRLYYFGLVLKIMLCRKFLFPRIFCLLRLVQFPRMLSLPVLNTYLCTHSGK
jgi:hypothetical protein